MKNKFKYLVGYSLKKKISTKWFKVVNILLCLLLIFLVNMDSIINLFGGDFNKKDVIYVVDNTGHFESFKNYFDVFSEAVELDNYEIKLDSSIIDKKEELDDEVIIVLNPSSSKYLSAEVISYDTVGTMTYQVINSSLNALKSEIVYETSGLSSSEIASLTSPVEIVETVLNANAKDNQTKDMISSVVTTIVIVPFFVLIVTMVQMIGAEINDEKTSRGMEIIISSVPAKMHFLSKVISALSYVLLQGLLLIGYVVIAIIIRKVFSGVGGSAAGLTTVISDTITMLKNAGVFSLLAKGAIPLIILYVVSFLAYAIFSATLASMTTNNEDFQQLQTPLMIIMMVGYYLALMAVLFEGSLFINIVSFIPLLSVLLAPTLYLMGQMSLVALIATTLVTCISTYILYIYGLRIYKVGILNYSSSKLWGKMFKSLKNK